MVSRIALSMILTVTIAGPGFAQPCNPAIDGTYCASQPDSDLFGVGSSTHPLNNAQIGLSPAPMQPGLYDQPATLGAITFGGGSSCIGLLRRARCN